MRWLIVVSAGIVGVVAVVAEVAEVARVAMFRVPSLAAATHAVN